MNEQLKEKTEEWMSLERKTLEQRKKADQYYEKNLMKLIETDFVERNKNVIKEKVDYLLISVGTSYEPIVLDLVLLKPKNIAFLYTEKSRETLDKVVEYTKLKATQYEKRKINETDPIDIYRNVKDIYLFWNSPSKMYIDFTGGTKAMSAACALAGAIIDVTMVYVASDDYLVDFRKPNPGSEKLIYIDNPLSVFGDLEVDKAYELFNKHNFEGSREKFKYLKDNIPNPVLRQELNFSYLLSSVYSSWDALEFVDAKSIMDELNHQLNRDIKEYAYLSLVQNKKILESQSERLSELSKIPQMISEKKQEDILKNLKIIVALMFTMFMSAKTREIQKKYDMATLLMYRLLEMIEQRRLSKYNLFVSDMIYENLRPNEKRTPELIVQDSEEMKKILSDKVYNIKRALFGNRTSNYLPNPVSLLDGYIILAALCDPVVYSPNRDPVNILKQMRSMVFQRNNSIFAHGLGPVSKRDYEKFRDFVITVFNQFCKIEHIDFEQEKKIFWWLQPDGNKES